MTDDLLTTRQVSAILGISDRTITWRARNGLMEYSRKLPATGTYLFDADYIHELEKDTSRELHKDNPARYREDVA